MNLIFGLSGFHRAFNFNLLNLADVPSHEPYRNDSFQGRLPEGNDFYLAPDNRFQLSDGDILAAFSCRPVCS